MSEAASNLWPLHQGKFTLQMEIHKILELCSCCRDNLDSDVSCPSNR